MWNSFTTDAVKGMVVGVASYAGAGGQQIPTYVARPEGPGPFPAVLVVMHAPGWDEFLQEFTRRLANHGIIGACPNLYIRAGNGTPDDVAARVRTSGGIADDQVVGDCEAALAWIKSQPISNQKVGITGMCSAGRHATLVAGRVPGFDALADLWGARVVMTP
jgi:carboxymethylenebutenolidase